MTPEEKEIRQLFDYNDWANQRSRKARRSFLTSNSSSHLAPASFGARHGCVHICSGEWVWLRALSGDARRLLFPRFAHQTILRFAITGPPTRNSCEHVFGLG